VLVRLEILIFSGTKNLWNLSPKKIDKNYSQCDEMLPFLLVNTIEMFSIKHGSFHTFTGRDGCDRVWNSWNFSLEMIKKQLGIPMFQV
jgi:hypothetical protein